MQANWPACIEFTLSFEGGYDANPKDRGNWTSGVIGQGELKGTKYGIAAHVYPQLDIRNLSKQQAIDIYRRDYWPKVDGQAQPPGVDLVAFDTCVNSGASRALAIEAAALNRTPSVGASILAAAARVREDKVGLIKTMCRKRESFYRSLRTFDTFGRGWLRRNAACEAKAVGMALRHSPKTEAEIKDALAKESKKADTAATTNGGGAVTTGGGGAGGTAQADWQIDWTLGLKVAGLILIVLLGAYFIRKFMQHRERAKAYRAEAQAVQP